MAPALGLDVSNVKVVVRVRPETSSEFESSTSRSVVKVLDSQVLVFDPKDDEEDFFYHGKCQKHRDLLKREKREARFMFDRIFDETALNPLVYENTTCGLLGGLLNGYNCTVFAYGATGAGKTYTMLGNHGCPGIIYLTVKDLFERIEDIKHEKTCEVAVSYLEVYNETIKDLLAPSGHLSIREDPKRGVTVSGLSLQKPKDADQLFAMLERGNKNRTQHPTDANAESSRSHAVFTVHIRQRDRLGDISENVRLAKMCLVDLAGSERATMVSRNKKERIREGANINKSLLALGSCINALADSRTKLQYVPYRNSKLTHLLKDSLGGNCRTIMIAAVSSSSLSYEDTYNTLKYAERAKHISINLKKNEVNIDNHVTKYRKLVEDLRQEVTSLKMEVQEYKEGRVPLTCVPTHAPFGSPKVQDVTRLKDVITEVFLERRRLRKDALELESAIRNIDVRIHCRQAQFDRLSLLSINSVTLETSTAKADGAIRTLQIKKERLEEKRDVVLQNIAQNKERIVRVESECKLIDPDGTVPELLTEIHSRNRAEVELAEARLETEHVKQFAHISMKENEKVEKLLNKVLPLTRNLYLILKGHGYATNDIQQDFANLVKQLESTKEVGWADWAGTDSPDAYNNVLDLQHVLNLPITENIQFTPATGRLRRRSRRKTGALSQINSPRRQISMEVDPETPQDKVTSTVQTPLQTPVASSHNTTFSASADYGCNDMSGVFEMNMTTPLRRSLESTFTLESDLPPSPILSSQKPSVLWQPEPVQPTSPKNRRLTFDGSPPAAPSRLDSISSAENEVDAKENLNETFVKPAPIQRLPRTVSNLLPMRVPKQQPSNMINTATVRKNIEDLKKLGLPSVYEAIQDTAFRGPLRSRQEPLRIRSRSVSNINGSSSSASLTRLSRFSSHPYTVSRMKIPSSSNLQTRSTSRLAPTNTPGLSTLAKRMSKKYTKTGHM